MVLYKLLCHEGRPLRFSENVFRTYGKAARRGTKQEYGLLGIAED
jgi:hypothetical protein